MLFESVWSFSLLFEWLFLFGGGGRPGQLIGRFVRKHRSVIGAARSDEPPTFFGRTNCPLPGPTRHPPLSSTSVLVALLNSFVATSTANGETFRLSLPPRMCSTCSTAPPLTLERKQFEIEKKEAKQNIMKHFRQLWRTREKIRATAEETNARKEKKLNHQPTETRRRWTTDTENGTEKKERKNTRKSTVCLQQEHSAEPRPLSWYYSLSPYLYLFLSLSADS